MEQQNEHDISSVKQQLAEVRHEKERFTRELRKKTEENGELKLANEELRGQDASTSAWVERVDEVSTKYGADRPQSIDLTRGTPGRSIPDRCCVPFALLRVFPRWTVSSAGWRVGRTQSPP